jgi:hypothetical protein
VARFEGSYEAAQRGLLFEGATLSINCSLTPSGVGVFEPHDRYRARLKAEYGRRTSFWSLIS